MRPGEFSARSIRRLHACHPDLIKLCHRVVLGWDCTVLCGHRSEEEQERVFVEGWSTVRWPDSKHNAEPSLAVDLAPWHSEESPPIDWKNTERWRAFGGFVIGVAFEMGIKIRWGGDWNGNWDFRDQRFIDLPHFELRQ